MDMIKIGKFLSEMRTANGLTQAELGKELGVTNKTVSRWENGNYLPPVEMLQLLSAKYGISINEILSGERLHNENEYKQKAEENLTLALTSSAFTHKDRAKFFRKKWFKEHAFELVIEILAILVFIPLSLFVDESLFAVMGIAATVWSFQTTARLQSYIDKHIFEEALKMKSAEDEKE